MKERRNLAVLCWLPPTQCCNCSRQLSTPLTENCLNALQGCSWFSTLDLRARYHKIPTAEMVYQSRTPLRVAARSRLWDASLALSALVSLEPQSRKSYSVMSDS